MNLIDENYNWLFLKYLLTKATVNVRKVFLETWEQTYKTPWNDKVENELENRGLTFRQANKSQKEFLKRGNSEDWDISLLALIFRNEPFNLSDKASIIKDIKDLRNNIDHQSSMKIPMEDF